MEHTLLFFHFQQMRWLIYNVKYFTGNKYLVTGADGEPLIKNVKILKKL